MADETDGLVLPVGVTDKKFIQAIARMEARMTKMEGEATKSFTGVSKSASKAFNQIDQDAQRMGKNIRGQLQNVGYQVQDFFVQVGAGTSATQALSQQLPQLLSGFGLIGIAAGVAAPLVVSLMSALLGSGNSAEDAEKQMKSLSKAMEALDSANKNANTSSVDLSAKFGPMAEQAQQLYAVQKQLAELNLTRELNKTASMIGGSDVLGIGSQTADQWKAFGEQFDNVQKRAEELAKLSMTGNMTEGLQAESQAMDEFIARSQNYITQMKGLMDTFNVSQADAVNLAAAFAQLRDAQGPDAIASAAANLRENLAGALKNMDGTNVEAANLVEQLLNAEDAALRAKAIDMSAPITAAAEEAKRLSDELNKALGAAQALSASGISDLTTARINEQYRTDPVGKAGALAGAQFDATRPTGADAVTMKEWLVQRREYIATQEEVARSSERVKAANDADKKAAQDAAKALRDKESASRRAAKAEESAQAKYDKAIISLQGNTDAVTQQIAAYEGLNLAGGDIQAQLTAITERQKLLTAAAKAGIDLTPEQIAQADQLSQTYADQVAELDRLKSVTSSGQNAMNDLFGSVLDGAGSAKEAVANLLKEIAKVQFSKGAMSLLGMTSWGSGLVSGIGSLLTANAKGGVYDSPSLSAYSGSVVSSPTLFKFAKGGSLGLMGEAGSEAILPLSRMTNGELGVKTQGDSRTSTAHISIDVTGAKGNTEIQEMVAAGVSQGLSAYDKQLPGRVQQISNNPRRR